MNLGDLLWVFFISAAPVSELRGGIPVALFKFHLPWYSAFLVSFLGNLFPVPVLLLFLKPLSELLSKINPLEKVLNWGFEHTRQRGRIVERYERIGLMLFVTIPLPWTGAWTGSVVAFLLGLKFRHAFLSIFLGVFIAGVIVTVFCLLGWIGAVIAGICLAILAIISLGKI